MMTEADFAALNEHLQEVRPTFDAFCARHGFEHANRTALGRYPRIRIWKVGETTIWFDLWMGLDKDGRRFERFRCDLPYDLCAGADVVVQDGSKYGVRFGKLLSCFVKPFDQVGAVLQTEMEKHLPTLEGWTKQYLSSEVPETASGSPAPAITGA